MTAGSGSATPLASQYWSKLPKADRFEWLAGFFGDKSGGKTFAAGNETTSSIQTILNEAGEYWSWRAAEEFADAVDEEARAWKERGYKFEQRETEDELNLETVLDKYIGDSRMMNSKEIVFLRGVIEASHVAPGLRFLERIQADDPGWREGEHVKFSIASFSAAEFSKGDRAGNIGWKSTDQCIVRVNNPSRGLTISYATRNMMTMQFDAASERETLLGGNYVIESVEQIVEPHTTPAYGYRIPLYILRES